MQLFVLVLSPVFATLVFWSTFVACIDTPLVDGPPIARVVASWDPLACGEPHRVVVELADDAGAEVSASAPCASGGLSVDVPHFGVYYGRVYAWAPGDPMRSVVPVRLVVDEPVVQWAIEPPR